MRTTDPFAAPPKRKAKKIKVETPDGRAEMDYVRGRDNGCVARLIRLPGSGVPLSVVSKCEGRIEVDHVRASEGIGMKSPTVRTNLVSLCSWHHRLKTDHGKTWRPLLTAYLQRVEPDAA